MRKSMKLGAASALAAVAIVAGSASAASAGTGHHPADDPYVCGNTEAEADGDITGDGSVPNCQFGDINIFNTNNNENENENESVNVNENEADAEAEADAALELTVDLGGLLGGGVVPAPAPAPAG